MLFTPIKIGNTTINNRAVMPPMCMYTVEREDGLATNFHLQHYLSRAIAGVGLIIQEATAVMSFGRITNNDLGLWNDSQVKALSHIVEAVKNTGAKMIVQISHAGRKTQTTENKMWGPSALQFQESFSIPQTMDNNQIKEAQKAFVETTKRALQAGYDGIELHGAHGYLISSFLSPLTNQRNDEYGGSEENRLRFLKEVVDEIKTFFPKDKILGLRISAEDYVNGGNTIESMVSLLKPIAHLLDVIHVSSGGVDSRQVIHDGPLYQVEFANIIKEQLKRPTIAVGKITTIDQAQEILKDQKADMVAFGRAILRDPFLLAHHHNEYMKNYPGYFRGISEI